MSLTINPQDSVLTVAQEITLILNLLQEMKDNQLTHTEVRAIKRKLRKFLREELTHPTNHHRLSKDKGGGDEPENISIVPQNLHEHFHGLFGTAGPEEIAKVLTDIWIPTTHELIAIRR